MGDGAVWSGRENASCESSRYMRVEREQTVRSGASDGGDRIEVLRDMSGRTYIWLPQTEQPVMVMAFLVPGMPIRSARRAHVLDRQQRHRRQEGSSAYLASSLVAKTTSANPVGEGRAGKWSVVETTVPAGVAHRKKAASTVSVLRLSG